MDWLQRLVRAPLALLQSHPNATAATLIVGAEVMRARDCNSRSLLSDLVTVGAVGATIYAGVRAAGAAGSVTARALVGGGPPLPNPPDLQFGTRGVYYGPGSVQRAMADGMRPSLPTVLRMQRLESRGFQFEIDRAKPEFRTDPPSWYTHALWGAGEQTRDAKTQPTRADRADLEEAHFAVHRKPAGKARWEVGTRNFYDGATAFNPSPLANPGSDAAITAAKLVGGAGLAYVALNAASGQPLPVTGTPASWPTVIVAGAGAAALVGSAVLDAYR